jgi:hypothetical protein
MMSPNSIEHTLDASRAFAAVAQRVPKAVLKLIQHAKFSPTIRAPINREFQAWPHT